MSLRTLNPNAESLRKSHALSMNIAAAKGLQNVLKTNLGPKGTLKMLVSGAGQIKLTKDGNVLLHEMQIQHPTAALIARTATAQDDVTGDGTTSNVLFTGELLKQAERYLADGIHPRVLTEGIERARDSTLKFLEEFKTRADETDRELLINVARTSLRTKVHQQLADQLTEIVVDAVLMIRRPDFPIDLHMVEIMHMQHKLDTDTRLVQGLVLDHGARHPDMKKRATKCHILIANVSLEYEKTEVNSGVFYSTAEERERLVSAEREYVNQKVRRIIELKERVVGDKNENFVVVNQKGIDPISLDMLARANIIGIRRAKRRNMERLSLACGGYAVNSVDDLTPECLGFAEEVYEHVLGEDKYTFIEGVPNRHSCTILIKGPNPHTIAQIKDAVHDGLRAVKNVLEDGAVVAGAGAFEIAAHVHLVDHLKNQVQGKAKTGVQAFADALLVIPKTLAENAGLDTTESYIKLTEEARNGNIVGLDLSTGDVLLPQEQGIWDNYRVKRQFLHLGSIMATKLLLVDEVISAGKQMKQGGGEAD